MQKIGILGCAGFIGSHLVERLLSEKNYLVNGCDIVSKKIEHLLDNHLFHFEKIDIHEDLKVATFINKCDIVVSLVAICNPAQYNTIPLEVININFTKPMHFVSLCAQLHKRLIYFSTSEVYGKTVQGISRGYLRKPRDKRHYLLSEDTTPLILGPVSAQRWSYACAKQLIERVIYAYGQKGMFDYTIIRPFNFIGPRMDYIPSIDGEGIPRVIACFMDALLFKKPLQLVDGGTSRRAFTAVDDAMEAIVRIIENPEKVKNQIFNIGNPNNEVTIEELAKLMVSCFIRAYPERFNSRILSVSSKEFYGEGYDDSDRRVPDISKAKKLLHWLPKIKLQTAIEQTMKSYVAYCDSLESADTAA